MTLSVPNIFATQSGPIPLSQLDADFTYVLGLAAVAQTAAEAALSITPQNYAYPPGNVLRYGADPTGVSDSTTAIQNAINVAAYNAASGANCVVYIPWTNAYYNVSSTLTVNAGVVIQGQGCVPYVGAPTGSNRGPGSWLYFNHTNTGILVQQPSAGNPFSGAEIRQIGTFRNQPAPSSGTFTPNANGYDIYGDNVDLLIYDVMLLNATAGVYFTTESLSGYGRLDIDRLRGQVFNDMIHINAAFDVCKISNVHQWPFWCAASTYLTNVQAYQNQNANVLFIARCDSPQISKVFGFSANAGIRFAQNSLGSCTYGQFTDCDFDNCIYGVYVDSTVTNLLVQFENLVSLSPTSAYVTGSINVLVNGSNAQMDFGKCEFRQAQQNAVQVNGSGNRLSFGGTFQAVVYNQAAGSYNAIQNNGANSVIFAGTPLIDTSGPAKYAGTGNIYADDWRSYTPTVTAAVGTITTVGALNCWWKQTGTTVTVNYDIAITTNGSGSSVLNVTLPGSPTSVNVEVVGAGRELNVTGKMLQAYLPVGQTYFQITNYDNTYPASSGCRLVGSLAYEISTGLV